MHRQPSGAKIYGRITIRDISTAGLGIELPGDPDVARGDTLNVIFDLDSSYRSIVQESVVVRNVREKGSMVGAEFVNAENARPLISAFMEKLETIKTSNIVSF
jgi:hypothetical protein